MFVMSRKATGRHQADRFGTDFRYRARRRHGNRSTRRTKMKPKNTICLWFDKDALEAARFYAATFPNSEVTAVHMAPGDFPGGKEGDVLTVEFTVLGIPCLGPNGGNENPCGWCKDRWGLSWQITPRALTDALAAGGAEAKRAFSAMMSMKKIDVATIEAARRG